MSTSIDNPIRNGVDTATLFATLDAVKANNEIAKFQFRASNTWISGTHNQSTIHGFYGAMQEMEHAGVHVFDADHPAVLVGADNGPTPVEYVLHALAACLTAGIANIAAARGVNLTSVESTVEGDIDLLGILGLGERRGPQRLSGHQGQLQGRGRRLRRVAKGRRAVDRPLGRVRHRHQRRSRRHRGRRRLSRDPDISPPTRDGAASAAGRPTDAPRPRPGGTTVDTTITSGSNNTIIIGGGQAGLALSRCLTDRGHDHVVIERGRVAERWHSERWDSLRLLTPNWMTRLPGYAYTGDDPDGFMPAHQVAEFFTDYARLFLAPVLEHTAVEHVTRDERGFVVTTDRGRYGACNVVIATGWCDRAAIPQVASRLPARVHQVTPSEYRRPDDLPSGGVLVVGASATGVQLAHELHRSGRPVTLAVGSHSRMPRRYRGMDTFWWLDQIGAFDRTIDDVDDVDAARHEPSLQLVGHPDHCTLDLTTLQADGVRLTGRLDAIDGERIVLSDDLGATVAAADDRMRRILDRIDDAIERLGLASEVLDPAPIAVADPNGAPRSVHLGHGTINSVVWATGYTRRYDWLDLPVLDGFGEIRQRRGVTPVAGAYVLGQRFQHFRNSNFIDGIGRDAEFVAGHICTRPLLDRLPSTRSRQN
jgi:putative flavoprotein involved in K+ transport